MQRLMSASLTRSLGVLMISLLLVIFVGIIKTEATIQPISFGAKIDFGAGSHPTSVAVGDFNRDGKPDLAVANSNSNNVSILLGTGAGNFGAKTDFAAGNGAFSVASGDFNRDGSLDLAVANESSNTVSILLGTGTGSFGAKTDFGTGNSPTSVAVGDFNLDGQLDLAVANLFGDSVSILIGTGTGSFGAKNDFGAGGGARSVAVGDFNRDGKLDLAVANSLGGHTVSILLGTGTGVFGPKTAYDTGDPGSSPDSVAVGDFNGDGNLDLAVTNSSSNTVAILLGAGTGSFGPKTEFATNAFPTSVVVGDFNNDGKPDLAVTCQVPAQLIDGTVSILLGTGTGSFGAKTDFEADIAPFSVAAGDFNADGKSDLVVTNSLSSSVSLFLNTTPISPSGVFCPKTDFGTGMTPASLATGDFNDDGKLDLAVANLLSNNLSILLGTGTGSFGAKTDFGTGNHPESVAVGDFNADGKLDLAVPNSFSHTVSILLGTGAGSFAPKTDFGTGRTPFSIALGDFNLDGKIDIATANFDDDTVSILLGTGAGSFGAKNDFVAGNGPRSVSVGDFNGDGKLDLAVVNFFGDTVSILLGTGTGSFGVKVDYATGHNPISIAVGDFNGDGKLDLVVANEGFLANSVSVLLGTGAGTFGAKTDYDTGVNPVSVAIGDFNADGKLDLAVVDQKAASPEDSTVAILLGTGTGSFGGKTEFATGAGSSSVSVADFNGDGKLDLAVTNAPVNTVSILLNGCDTQPPSITCPPNMTAVTNQGPCAAPGSGCQVVTFEPSASDNFPGVTTMCSPASGSCFPVGTTTVTCTARDSSGNTAKCSFTVTIFDVAIQDDSSSSTRLLWNSITGEYRFCCNGTTYAGVGKATAKGCLYTLETPNATDRRITGRVDKGGHTGTATIQNPPGVTRCAITDRNTLNDTNLASCQ